MIQKHCMESSRSDPYQKLRTTGYNRKPTHTKQAKNKKKYENVSKQPTTKEKFVM